MRPDIVVRDAAGNAVLAVEVKARRGVDRDWAAGLRRNLQAHGAQVAADYFMILTADDVYLWREHDDDDTLAIRPPDGEARTRDVLGDQVEEASMTDGRTLELLASAWLTAVAETVDSSELPAAAGSFLVESGLHRALRGAAVAFEPA